MYPEEYLSPWQTRTGRTHFCLTHGVRLFNVEGKADSPPAARSGGCVIPLVPPRSDLFP